MSDASDRRTFRTFLFGGGRQMLSLLPSLIVYPIIARDLGDHQFGAWTLIGAAGFMLILSDAGLSTAVRRAAVTDDHGLARRTMGLALLTITTLLPIGIGLLLYFMLDFTEVNAGLRAEARTAAMVMMIGGSLGALANPFMDFVYARGGSAQVARARILGSSAQIALLLGGFFLWRKSILVPAAASTISSGIQLTMLARAARGHDPELPLLPQWPRDRPEALRSFGDGIAQLAINAAVVMALRIDYAVLEWAAAKHALRDGLSAREASEKALTLVGKYGLAGLAVDMSYSVAKQANTAIMRSLGRRDERASAFRIGTLLFSGVIVSGMSAIAFAGQPFIAMILGEKARGLEVFTTLHLLGAAAMLLSTYEVAGAMVMLSARSAWACATPYIVGALVNLALSVTFAPLAPLHGMVAVAGSTIVGNLVACVLMWRQVTKLLEWGRKEVLSVFVPVAASAVVASVAGFVLAPHDLAHPVASLFICIVVTLSGLATLTLFTRNTWKAQGIAP
jgi:O-antigen/teichoic acid export membrane protein